MDIFEFHHMIFTFGFCDLQCYYVFILVCYRLLCYDWILNFIAVLLNKDLQHDICALLDRGSMKSFASEEIFAKLCSKPALAKISQNCVSITDQPLVFARSTQFELSFPDSGSVFYVGQFLVSSTLCSPLEGVLEWDFLTSNSLHLPVMRMAHITL